MTEFEDHIITYMQVTVSVLGIGVGLLFGIGRSLLAELRKLNSKI